MNLEPPPRSGSWLILLVAGIGLCLPFGVANAADPAEPPSPGQEVRTVPVTVIGERSFRDDEDWRRVAERGIAIGSRDLPPLAGLRFVVARFVEWNPDTQPISLPEALLEADRIPVAGQGLTVVVVGDRYFKKLSVPGVSFSFRGRPAMILVAVKSFRTRLGRNQREHLAWLFRHELGHVFGAPERLVNGIMHPRVEDQTWEYDEESLAILRAARTMDFASPSPFAGCDLNKLRDVFLRLEARREVDAVSLVNLGVAFQNRKEADVARDLFERALELERDSPVAQLGLARTLMDQEDTLGARLLLEAIPTAGFSPPEMGLAGGLWGGLGAYGRAETMLTSAILADSTRFSLWFKRGLTRFRQQQFMEARSDFQRALTLEERAEGWFNLGLVCDALEDRPCAEAAFIRYLEIEPSGAQHEQAQKFLKRQRAGQEGKQ